MRVSVPPTTALPEPVLGRAVIFAVSSAWAVVGAYAPTHTSASATAMTQTSFWSKAGSEKRCSTAPLFSRDKVAPIVEVAGKNETEMLSVKRSAKALSAKAERAREQSSSYFT